MRIETNEALVRRNRRLANFLFFFSMAVLAGGFLVANMQVTATKDPNVLPLAFISWLVLPIGFVSTMISVRMTNLWLRRPRPENAIQEGLKGLSKRSVLYNYYHFPARHVLIAPQGVFAIVTRFQDGRFSVTGDQWKSQGGLMAPVMRFLRRDAISNPTEEAQRAADHVRKLLSKGAPDVEVQPLIVFVDPRATLQITDPVVPVLYADDRKEPNLRDFMRELAQKQQAEKQPEETRRKGSSRPSVTEKPRESSGVIDIQRVADALEEVTILS